MSKRLDINEKQDVQYAVPLWLRDEQVRVNSARVPGRIQPNYDKRQDPVAIVCYGPSLNETWEQVRGFPFIISCSGAHKFLLERGIVPSWHVEVDPRDHKVELLGLPHAEVEYLPSSTCHPKYIEHLMEHGANVKLWHVFSPHEDVHRVLPAGEWALTGGSSVGLRALTIARFMGFTELHIFGMDGCFRKDVGNHAAAHPNQPRNWAITEYKGKEYFTNSSVMHCAQETWHELDQMPDVKATFYGEGLVQAMAKDYQQKSGAPATPAVIGFAKPELISAEYAELNAQLHRDNLAYGVGGGKHAETVQKLVGLLAKKSDRPVSVLDYGCGKSQLQKALAFPIYEYDPGIPGKQESPRSADLVICTDVLEHVEPDKLFYVLDDLCRCVRQLGFFTINTGPAAKTLPDGRNTHLIQKGAAWWRKKLEKFFKIGQIIARGAELYVVVAPKSKKENKHDSRRKAG
jgi:uncharacterized Rossmann fold enzyme